VAFFVHPDDHVEVANLTAEKDGKAWYKPSTAKQLLLDRFAATYYA